MKPYLLPGGSDGEDDIGEELGPEAAREQRVDEVSRPQVVAAERLELVRHAAPDASLAAPEACSALPIAHLAGREGHMGPSGRSGPDLGVDREEHTDRRAGALDSH